MCTSCGAKTYGQSQPEERKKDAARLDRVRDAAARKSAAKNN